MKDCPQGNPHRFVVSDYPIGSFSDYERIDEVRWCQDCGYFLVIEQMVRYDEVVSEKESVSLMPKVSR